MATITELEDRIVSLLSSIEELQSHDWTKVVAEVAIIGPAGEYTYIATSSDHLTRFYPDVAEEIEEALMDAFDELKNLSYTSEHGAWLSVEITVGQDGAAIFDYNYDDEPETNMGFEDEDYKEEFETYPRPVQPSWV